MQREGADGVAAPAEHRDRDERLELLLLQLRHVLHARVVERVVADERRFAVVERPPREPLAALELDLAGERGVRLGSRAQHEALSVTLEEIDEAGVGIARVREEPHDAVEHLLEIEGGTDGRDDFVEEALLDLVRPLARSDSRIVRRRTCGVYSCPRGKRGFPRGGERSDAEWARLDSNQGPIDYESTALTS